MDRAIKESCGEVALRLNGHRMLVTLSFSGYLTLRRTRNISHIGPVSVDMKRLSQTARMLTKAKPAP